MALFVLHRPIEVLAIEHDALVFIGRHPFKRKLVRVPFREIARVVQGHEYGYGHRLRIELASGRHHKLLFFARSQLKRRPYSELINRTEIRFPSSADGADFASKVSELLTALGVEAGSDPLPSFHRVRLARPRGE